MLAAYGVDVLDPALSVRRVHVLLERLPPPARVLGEQWSTESELLAHLIDAVADLTWVTVRAYGGTMQQPRPVKRPPLRDRAQQATAAAPRAVEQQPGAGVQTSSWAEAGMMLAGMPGMRVHHG